VEADEVALASNSRANAASAQGVELGCWAAGRDRATASRTRPRGGRRRWQFAGPIRPSVWPVTSPPRCTTGPSPGTPPSASHGPLDHPPRHPRIRAQSGRRSPRVRTPGVLSPGTPGGWPPPRHVIEADAMLAKIRHPRAASSTEASIRSVSRQSTASHPVTRHAAPRSRESDRRGCSEVVHRLGTRLGPGSGSADDEHTSGHDSTFLKGVRSRTRTDYRGLRIEHISTQLVGLEAAYS